MQRSYLISLDYSERRYLAVLSLRDIVTFFSSVNLVFQHCLFVSWS